MAEADTGCMYVIQISVPSGVDSGNPGDVLQRARAAVKEAAGENLVHMLKVCKTVTGRSTIQGNSRETYCKRSIVKQFFLRTK